MSTELVMNTVLEARELFLALQAIQNRIHQQLLSRDISALQQTLKEQSGFVSKVRQNATLRSRLLKGMGYEVSGVGIKKMIATMPVSQRETALSEWIKLEQSIVYCQELNKLNGKVQARLSSVTRRLLNMMNDHFYRVGTYSSNGVAIPMDGHHEIGNA
ncbi:flagellar protein FlgN [Endozoicomonas sp. Mp262]|uniref:flagellar protein FlgN n=1 Tax=Endozoicomonas sp. Mp262 TaxID=2919499 RepID=UPI0021DA5209